MESTPAPAAQLHPSRLRAAMATPSSWVDALVEWTVEGTVALRALDGARYLVQVDASPAAGEPVAFHPVFGVIAVAGRFHRAA